MKKSLISLLVLGLLAGSLVGTAEAKKKHKKPPAPARVERVVEVKYQMPPIGVSGPSQVGAAGICPLDLDNPGNCVETPTTGDDMFVKVEVDDAAGQKVAGFLSQGDTNGDGVSDGYGTFCGSSADPIPVAAPGVPLRVSFYAGVCDDNATPSLPTTGTIKLTFSNLP